MTRHKLCLIVARLTFIFVFVAFSSALSLLIFKLQSTIGVEEQAKVTYPVQIPTEEIIFQEELPSEETVAEPTPEDLVNYIWEEKELSVWVLDNQSYLAQLDEQEALDLVNMVKDITSDMGVDYIYVLSVMSVESGFYKDATSRSGACGLMQIVPKWFRSEAQKNGIDNFYDPESNVYLGANYLDTLYSQFGDLYVAAAAYNRGPEGAYGASTYAAAVMDVYEELKGRLE